MFYRLFATAVPIDRKPLNSHRKLWEKEKVFQSLLLGTGKINDRYIALIYLIESNNESKLNDLIISNNLIYLIKLMCFNAGWNFNA